ncbi:hypothetical protein SO802_010667 [Lithocarpus litseifolius]|uniref:Uncharacterized protein n=1 Tax=Lithocarpus litseifolius TaxID=425828 RepID=A0AAW2DEU8_9ROSI
MPSKFPPPWLTLILDSKFYENCDEHEGLQSFTSQCASSYKYIRIVGYFRYTQI